MEICINTEICKKKCAWSFRRSRNYTIKRGYALFGSRCILLVVRSTANDPRHLTSLGHYLHDVSDGETTEIVAVQFASRLM